MNISNSLKYLALVVGTAVVTFMACRYLMVPSGSPAGSPKTVQVNSDLSVKEKTSPSEPDLEVSQKYTAVINGKKVEVPVNAATGSTAPASTGTNGTSASLRQEVDITPLVDHMVPKWELGVGIGKQKGDSRYYVPLSLQRNYAFDKAIQFELHVDPSDKKINGVEVQHKWRF